MFPGMGNINPKMMKQAMKKMGIKQEEIDALEVIIKCSDKEIIVTDASVQKIEMQGNISFQVSGNVNERHAEAEVNITEEDIKTVAEQTNVSDEKAREALEKAKGDLAKAIISLQDQ